MDITFHTSCQQRKLCTRFQFRPQINQLAIHFHNPIGQPYNSGLLLWRLHDMPLQVVTCHFFVEAFIIISHVISHCICSMYNVLTCSGTYVTFIHTSYHPPSDTGVTNALELFLLHKEFNHCTLANKCHWQPHFLQHTTETLIKRHMHQIQEM